MHLCYLPVSDSWLKQRLLFTISHVQRLCPPPWQPADAAVAACRSQYGVGLRLMRKEPSDGQAYGIQHGATQLPTGFIVAPELKHSHLTEIFHHLVKLIHHMCAIGWQN